MDRIEEKYRPESQQKVLVVELPEGRHRIGDQVDIIARPPEYLALSSPARRVDAFPAGGIAISVNA